MAPKPVTTARPRRFYCPDLPESGGVELAESEAHHLIHVLRARTGESVELFDGRNRQAAARIETLSKRTVQLIIERVSTLSRELPDKVAIAAAIPKGDRQQVLIEKLSEVGCSEFWPVQFQRSSVRADKRSIEKWNRYVIEASKQCGRNQLMSFAEPLSSQVLFQSAQNWPRKWVADPGGEPLLGRDSPGGDTVVAIGPEGGLTDEELAWADEAGWTRINLGPRILRLETAAIVAVTLAGLANDRPHLS